MRAATSGFLAVLAAALLGPAGAGRAQPAPDPDQNFVCPDVLDSDVARMQQLSLFIASGIKADPGLSRPEILARRRELLEKHQCARTLQAQMASAQAVQSGAVQDQPWLVLGSSPTVTLAIGPDSVQVLSDPRHPGERAVEAYVRATYSALQTIGPDQLTYDEVISHALYYCPSGQRALVENDFFTGGKETSKQPSTPESVTPDGVAFFTVAAVPEGSLNAVVGRWLCAGATPVAAAPSAELTPAAVQTPAQP